jgi:phytoene dehydrogenase-like protein
MTVLFQYAPNGAAHDQVADLTAQTLEAHVPGLAERIVERDVVTPADLERDYGLTGGHPMHGEHALDQFFAWRPLLGHARYRLGDIRGLYLCGAGAHPGGGVSGAPGHNCARRVLKDLR